MAQVSTYRCDGCGKLKEEANHWLRAKQTDEPRFIIVKWENSIGLPGAESDFLHFCGTGCAVKAMVKAMEGGG